MVRAAVIAVLPFLLSAVAATAATNPATGVVRAANALDAALDISLARHSACGVDPTYTCEYAAGEEPL